MGCKSSYQKKEIQGTQTTLEDKHPESLGEKFKKEREDRFEYMEHKVPKLNLKVRRV